MVYSWFLNPLRVESFKALFFSFPQETTGRPLPTPLQPHVCYLWLLWESVLPVPCRMETGAGAASRVRPVGNCPPWLINLLYATPCGESPQGQRQFVLGCALGSKGFLCPFGETDLSVHMHFHSGDSAVLSGCTTTVPENVRDKEKGFWGCVLCP